jgi:hypothetical protein
MTSGLPHQIRGMVLWNSSPALSGLCLRGFHPLWQAVSGHFDLTSEEEAGSATLHLPLVSCGIRFGLFPFRSLLIRESRLFSFPPPNKMFQFGGFPLLTEHHGFRRIHSEKSHSGILGSTAACAYPRRFAACRALLQRLKPSHSPDGVACRADLLFGSNACLTFEELRFFTSGRSMVSAWCSLRAN